MSAEIEQEQARIEKDLRLRAPGAPIARVSRKALMIGGGVALTGVLGALVWSTIDHPRRSPPEAVAPGPARLSEKIAELPKDYLQRGEPPVLGPPLPGDLGRPMLSARADGVAVPDVVAAPSGGAPPPSPSLVGPPVDRSSALFLASAARPGLARPEPPAAVATDDPRTTSPERMQGPVSPYSLIAGTIVPAVLVTALRSDIQGVAVAQVTQDVRDSLTGRHLLAPAGSRLIGEYASASQAGQQRLAVVWTRLILPNGRSIVLDKLPGADPQGMAGLQDGVDRHWREVWTGAALSSVLAVGAEAGEGDETALTRALRRGVGQTASDVGQQVVGRSLGIAPTQTIRAGAPLRVVLARDLVLEPYEEVSR